MLRRRGWLLRRWWQDAFLKKGADEQTDLNPGRVLFLLVTRKSTLFYGSSGYCVHFYSHLLELEKADCVWLLGISTVSVWST